MTKPQVLRQGVASPCTRFRTRFRVSFRQVKSKGSGQVFPEIFLRERQP